MGQGVIASDDGTHWRALDGTIGNRNVRALAADLIFPQKLYAGTEDGVWGFTFVPPPPPPSVVWFYAEGSTQPPFDTWFLLQNPTVQAATATLTFLLEGGGTAAQTVGVPPRSRVSVFANQVLPNQAFSTRISADQPIYAERAMYVSFDGHLGGALGEVDAVHHDNHGGIAQSGVHAQPLSSKGHEQRLAAALEVPDEPFFG